MYFLGRTKYEFEDPYLYVSSKGSLQEASQKLAPPPLPRLTSSRLIETRKKRAFAFLNPADVPTKERRNRNSPSQKRLKLRDRAGDHGVETAFPLSLDDAVISLFTPGSSPAVLDLPVVLSVFRAPSNDQDSVVDFLFAAKKVKGVGDSSHVELHHSSVDSDRQRASGNELSSDLILVLRNGSPITDGRTDDSGGLLARPPASFVGVARFGVDAFFGDDKFVGIGGETAIAAHVAVVFVTV